MAPSNLSIKLKVALATTILGFLMIGALTVVLLSLVRDGLKGVAVAQETSAVTNAAGDLDTRLRQTREMLAGTAAMIPPEHVTDPARLREFLLAQTTLLVVFDDLVVADHTGQLIADAPQLPRRTNVNIGDRAYFKVVLNEGRAVISDAVMSRHRGEPIVIVAAPIRNAQGKPIAALTGVLRLEKSNMLGDLASARWGRSGYFALVSKSTSPAYIIHPDQSRILRPVVRGEVPALDLALAGAEDAAEGYDSRKQHALFAFKSLDTVPWLLVAVLPTSEALAPIAAAERDGLIIAGFVGLIAIPLLWLLQYRLLAPLSRLHASIQAMRSTPQSFALVPSGREDEVGALEQAISQLLREREESQRREHESETRFGAAALSSIDAFFLLDAQRDANLVIVDFRFRFANARGAALLKRNVDDLTGRGLCEVLGLRTTSRLFRQYVHTAESGAPLDLEFEVAIPQIDARWLHQQVVRAGDGLAITAADVSRRRAAEAEIERQKVFLRTIVDCLPVGLTVRTMRGGDAGRVIVWNRFDEEVYGVTTEHALGHTAQQMFPPATAARIEARDRELLANPVVQEVAELFHVPGRGERMLRIVRAPIFGADGDVEHVISIATDITNEQRDADHLRLASQVFESTADAIVVTNADDRVIMVNRAFTKLTGFLADDMLGRLLEESVFAPLDPEASAERAARQRRDGVVTAEVQRRHKDGHILDFWITAALVKQDGRILNNIRVFTDISELKATQRRLEELASLDALTGLPNRRLFKDRLTHAVARAERTGKRIALLFIDLDGFKAVNDRFGHDAGDELLKTMATRLTASVRIGDSVCRLGGDEFTIVLEDSDPTSEGLAIAQRILGACALPTLRGEALKLSGSIGMAVYPDDAQNPITLVERADAAMYAAKRAGGNRCVRQDAVIAHRGVVRDLAFESRKGSR
ncbi:MAG: diguanylate cyclase [Casimicrobiaceae bacterium]